ncbi:hypothetical protein [Cellulomonas sp. KRMCY2]|uniref:hypothetical protein n=1 Tax=Cellulomonas sp. KRMCY2 TaxID=1304865 RepID=UPI0004B6DD05|nr:hypothetical protein [Cellulomonas sp. KRMCY2]
MRTAGLSAALLLAGCAAQSGPLDRPEPEGPRPDLTLTAELSQTDTAVGWSWTLRNDDDAPVLVFVGPDPARMSADEPPPTWVLAAKGDTVELAQRLIAPPSDVDFASAYGVAARVLAPGEELTGAAEVRLPLTTTLPWGADIDSSRAVAASPSEVYLCVGVGTTESFGELPTVADQGIETTDGDAPYAMHSEWYVAQQHQFCTEPEPLG